MQIPNGISIEVGGVDADYVLYQVTVAMACSRGRPSCTNETLPADLAMLIEWFPLSPSDHRNREFGSRSERIAGGWLEVTCVYRSRGPRGLAGGDSQQGPQRGRARAGGNSAHQCRARRSGSLCPCASHASAGSRRLRTTEGCRLTWRWCSGILSTVDLHHGERAHDPPYSAIEVYGAAPSMTLRAAFASVGLPGLESIAGELRAISRPDA